LGLYFLLLQILVLYYVSGSSFGKGLQVDFLAAELQFLLPAPLVASFFLSTLCFPHWGKPLAAEQHCQQSAGALCGEMWQAAPPMGTDSLQSTCLDPVGGVGLGLSVWGSKTWGWMQGAMGSGHGSFPTFFPHSFCMYIGSYNTV